MLKKFPSDKINECALFSFESSNSSQLEMPPPPPPPPHPPSSAVVTHPNFMKFGDIS